MAIIRQPSRPTFGWRRTALACLRPIAAVSLPRKFNVRVGCIQFRVYIELLFMEVRYLGSDEALYDVEQLAEFL